MLMPKTEKVVGPEKCPYRVCRVSCDIPTPTIEERFDFQFEEDGKIGRVSLGMFDVAKEIDSHKDEVGLINVIRLAEARGLSLDQFAKTEPGLMVDVSGIETVDDLIQRQKENSAKLDEMAKQLGISTAELVAAVKAGDLSVLNKPEKEGGAEDGANVDQ